MCHAELCEHASRALHGTGACTIAQTDVQTSYLLLHPPSLQLEGFRR